MIIKPSAAIRHNYNEISNLCKSTHEPVFLTKNGEGDLVVMDMETYSHREKMLRLREQLLKVEVERQAGHPGMPAKEAFEYLESIIDEAGKIDNEAI